MLARPLVRGALAPFVGATLVAAVALSAAKPAQAQTDPARVPSAAAVQETHPTAVPPMGAKAAEITAKAREGAPRSAPKAGVARAAKNRTLAAGPFWELQLNLCNSGFAGCYRNGDAIYEGGDLIYYLAPDLVTLNEICLNDIASYLQPSLAEAWPADWTYSVFYPAMDQRTGAAFRCRNGDQFGNAVMGRIPTARYQGVNAWGGQYVTQDAGSNELRTFACAYAIGDHFACATHLAAVPRDPDLGERIALAQCQALMFEAVPYIRSVEGVAGRTVVGGDFNLEYDTSDPENVQKCVPAGNTRKGDGDVQHVIFTNDIGFVSTQKYGLTNTDHPGFLVRLTMP